jgi:hypothetical protein
MNEQDGRGIGLAPFAHMQPGAISADHRMNLHLDPPFAKTGLDDRRPALEGVLLRALKNAAETLESSLLERLRTTPLRVRSRTDRSLGTGRRNEGCDFSQEIGEGRLVAKQNMVCAI